MVREGMIVCVHHDHFGLGSPADLVTGEIEIRRSGDGILVPTEGGQEVFVSRDELGTALPFDLVVVRLDKEGARRERGRHGKVIRILKRSQRVIAGTLRATGRFYYVVPIDPVYERDFYVTNPKGARVNDRVVIRFTEWANRHVNPEAEIIEVIGPENNPSCDTTIIIRHYSLPDKFPDNVLREADAAVAALNKPGERHDFRGKFIFTIDPATARDYDDAISLEVDGKGRRVLGVHIADVSHFVRAGTMLDKEAHLRGNSVYFPDMVLPMLPEAISNGVCSLRPDEERLTFSVLMTFDADGALLAADFCRSIIRSRLRLTYEQAFALLKSPHAHQAQVGVEAHGLLLNCHALAQQLRKRRFAHYALNLDMPEYEIFIGRNGLIEDIRQRLSDISHQLIEEFMIAANEAVDRQLSEDGYAVLRRVHEPPAEEKIQALSIQLGELGFHPGNLVHRKNMADFLEKINGHPFEYDAKLAALKSMKRAVYSPEPLGHYGLAKKYYAHFTSPIRRYPDLVVHRVLSSKMVRHAPPYKYQELKTLGRHCSLTEQTADAAETTLIEIKKYRFLEQQIIRRKMDVYEAVVVRVKNFGMFVELTRLQIQGLVHVSSISRDFVRYDAHRQELRTRNRMFRVGSRVKVIVARVDFDKRQVDFVLAEDERKSAGKQT
jgi:ribonuclease R